MWRWLAPSVAYAAIASIVCGVVEAAGERAASTLGPLTAASVVVLVFFPLALLMSVGARLLWRGWRPILAETGTPRLLAWIAYLAGAVAVLNAAAMTAASQLYKIVNKGKVLSVGVGIVVVSLSVLLIVASRPIVDRVTVLLRRVDVKPRWIAVGCGVAGAVGLVVLYHVSIQPRLGDFDLVAWLEKPALLVALLVGLHVVHPHVKRPVFVAGAGVALATAAAAMVTPFWVAGSRPSVMLDVWGRYPLAGELADSIWRPEEQIVGKRAALTRRDPTSTPPNIVLITIDTMRADQTPPYGGAAIMPNLLELSRKGLTFEWAIAPSNVTRRSLPSIATGLSPRRILGRVVGWALRMDPRHVSLTERLEDAGYQTGGFFCCRNIFGPEYKLGLHRGFEHLDFDKDDRLLGRKAKDWIKKVRDDGKPYFVWVHMMSPHRWKDEFPEREFGKDRATRYRLGLAAADIGLAPLVDLAGKNTIVIVTSDHGEGLGDHGHENHGRTVYLSETRVPLIMAGGSIRPGRVEQAVSLVNLAPTILDLAGFDPPAPPFMEAMSLAPLARGEVPDDVNASLARTSTVKDNQQKKSLEALIAGRYRLVQTRDGKGWEVYDYRADPREEKDLARDQPELVEQLRERLEELKLGDKIEAF